MLETYNETPIFIPVDITEDADQSVARKLSRSSDPVGANSETLQEWVLNFEEYSKRLCSSVVNFDNLIANNSPPWAACSVFMYRCLIALDKQPGIRPVRVGETWRCIFANIILKVTRSEATSTCHDEQLFDGIKSVIDCPVHRVQDIWYTKFTTKDWRFLLVDAKTCSARSIYSEFCGQFDIYGHPELFFLIAIVTFHC